MSDTVEALLKQREDARSKALVNADYAALSDLTTDDLVHIHANGSIETKQEYLAGIEAKLEFLEVSRPQVNVRVFGDIAVMTGLLKQSVRVKGPGVVVDMQAAVTQVWRNEAGTWRICSFQATKID